jgi:hypothetical protein
MRTSGPNRTNEGCASSAPLGGGKLSVQARGLDLCDPLRAVEILELHHSEVAERDLGAWLVLDELPGGGRQQHPAAVGDCDDARSTASPTYRPLSAAASPEWRPTRMRSSTPSGQGARPGPAARPLPP